MDHTSVSHQRWQDHWLFLSHFRKSPANGRRDRAELAAARPHDARRPESRPPAFASSSLAPAPGPSPARSPRRLPTTAACLAIDIDPGFSARVAARWPQIAVGLRSRGASRRHRARAALLPIDHIVSGLPFASLPGDSARAIVDAIVASLRPGGTFTTFQYVHAFGFRSAVDVRRTLTRRMGSAPTRKLVVGNLPPALVLRWTKASPQRDHRMITLFDHDKRATDESC